MTGVPYLEHLAAESARFLAALDSCPASTPVPTCPDWRACDLLWHLAEVQWFWGEVVATGVTEHPGFDDDPERRPARPADQAGLREFFAQSSARLQRVLTAAPDTPAWTWSREQTVGFIRRRQAHEALIHRLDAELTAGSRTPMDPALAGDGIDEALTVMYGGVPPWATVAPSPGMVVALVATDTLGRWVVTAGRLTGVDPEDGVAYDEPALRVEDPADPPQAAAEISGPAADLDSWLWRRPQERPLARTGDPQALAALEAVLAGGIP